MIKTITWITPEYFIETDIHIVTRLCDYFRINWFIVFTGNSTLYSKEIENIKNKKSGDCLEVIKYVLPKKHPISITYLSKYWNLLKRVKQTKADLYYTAIVGLPYFLPLAMLKLPRKKTIIAAHNVTTPKGASYAKITSIYNEICYRFFENFQTFSKSQREELLKRHPKKNILQAPFVLKDYGKPTVKMPDVITFISFGRIRGYKCVDNIIYAAQKVADNSNKPFKIIIAGECSDWQKYAAKIDKPDIFELIIREIENEEIPNLFGRSHYSLYPYKDIAQSGALFVSLNYKVPPIVSDLPAFREVLYDRENAIFVRPSDKEDLYKKMLWAVETFPTEHNILKRGMEKSISDEYSPSSIVKKYIHFFNTLISN